MSVVLGSDENPIALPFDVPYYLGIRVGADEEMVPRIALASVPYALRAKHTDEVGDGTITSSKIAAGEVVKSINTLRDDVTLAAGANITLTPSGNTLTISADMGGDITEVNAGEGLSGGGASGEVTLSVNFSGSGSATTVARSDHHHEGMYAAAAHGHSAADITSGVLDNGRFSAYSDLTAEGYLDNNGDADLLTRGQADARYVKVGEAGSVTTGMLQDGAVSTAKLSDNAVTGPKIQDGAITVGKLSDGSVTSAKILDGSILFSDLGSNGCGANQVLKWNGSAWTCGNDEVGAGGDNLGDHVATQNVRLNGNWLSGDGESEGIFVSNAGKVGIGTSSPNEQLEITGNLRLPTTTATAGVIKLGDNTLIHSYGLQNFFAGLNAGNLSTTGIYNTATGAKALNSNTAGSSNTAQGVEALLWNSNGSWNTAIGRKALAANTDGWNNTACGSEALASNLNGNWNTASGTGALYSNSGGTNNTAIGAKSLYLNVSGENNTAVGADAGASSVGNRNVFLGYRSGFFETESNRLHIANSESATLIYGRFDEGRVCIQCTDPATGLDVNGQLTVRNWAGATSTPVCKNGNTLSDCSSSLRYKEQIEDLPIGLDAVQRLRPVSFKWKDREVYDLGLIAEEVAEVDPILVTYSSGGAVEGVKYMQLTAVLVKAIQELKAENEALKATLFSLGEKVRRLERERVR